jgi:dienelactone hydrolase
MQVPVSFENQGQQLFGMAHIPEGSGPWPGVVLCHGFTGTKVECRFLFVKLARELCKQGIAVMRFDFRGSGDSEGRFEDMTVPAEISDAKVAIDYFASYPGIDVTRLGLLGFSMGGCVATHTGSADPRIKSMTLWSPVTGVWTSLAECLKVTAPDEQGRYDLGGGVIGPDFIPTLKALDSFKAIKSFNGSLCIIHGSSDSVVNPAGSDKLFATANCTNKVIKKVEGADHGYACEAYEKELLTATVEWFKNTL